MDLLSLPWWMLPTVLFVLPVIYTFLASEHKPLPVFDESIPPKAKGSH